MRRIVQRFHALRDGGKISVLFLASIMICLSFPPFSILIALAGWIVGFGWICSAEWRRGSRYPIRRAAAGLIGLVAIFFAPLIYSAGIATQIEQHQRIAYDWKVIGQAGVCGVDVARRRDVERRATLWGIGWQKTDASRKAASDAMISWVGVGAREIEEDRRKCPGALAAFDGVDASLR